MTYKRNDPANWLTKSCPVCEKKFRCRRSQETTYCSRECHQSTLPGKMAAKCPECQEEFSYYAHWPRKYCSHHCRALAVGREQSRRRNAICESCKKSFEFNPSSDRGRFCSRRCWGDWLQEHSPRGHDHPNWRGGYEPYYGANWRQVRREVRAARGECADCGRTASELGRSLDVHHVVPFREFGRDRHLEANDPSNLAALCNVCHTAREWRTNRV